MKPARLLTLLPLLCLLLAAEAAIAQPEGRRLGLGGQVGDPSGLTLKLYRNAGLPFDRLFTTEAITFLAAWDLDEAFFLNIHLLKERPIQNSPLRFFLGPGGLMGIEDTRNGLDVTLGVSGTFGVNFFREDFEVFLQITPRLNILPDTEGNFGGGIGLRYYFR